MTEEIKNPKDPLNNELYVGADVIFMQVGYRSFMEGKIKSIAPKSALISHAPTNTGQTESRQGFDQIFLDTRKQNKEFTTLPKGSLSRSFIYYLIGYLEGKSPEPEEEDEFIIKAINFALRTHGIPAKINKDTTK